MQLGLGELTSQAQDLVAGGDLAGARDLLAPALSAADPSPARSTPELAEAAGLYARILVALGQPHDARPWAAYAYSALTRLYGSDDERTVTAGSALAAILHRVGSHSRAAHLYRLVIDELTAVDGPESQRVLNAHADLATVEHARGDCAGALNRLEEAWELHREVYGDGHPGGIKMLAKLAAMARDCGLPELAADHFALAQELCRAHLSPDHPLVAQVAALAAGTGAGTTAAASVVPPPRSPYEAQLDSDDLLLDGPPWQDNIGTPLTDDMPFSAAHYPPEAAAPDDRPEPVIGTAAADPAAERPGRARGWERLRVLRITRQRRPVDPAVVYRTRESNQLLPVVIAALVILLLGTIAVAAGVALVDGSRSGGGSGSTGAPGATTGPPRTARPSTTAPPATAGPASTVIPSPVVVAPFSPGAAPTGVALNDSRDAITLNWTYPAGATGPVVISGSRRGLEPRPLKELPAGEHSYVVYGLDRNIDFCFSVAIRYDPQTLGRAPTVCTTRTGG